MPALQVFQTRFFGFSTRPFAGDDLHLVCILVGSLRLIQFICLVPWMLYNFIDKLKGKNIWINDIPYWCPQYQALKDNVTEDIVFSKSIGEIYEDSAIVRVSSFESGDGPYIYGMVVAIVFLGINVCWLCMLWSATSLGTPTQPERRDKYLRPLIIFQLIAGLIFPIMILVRGIKFTHYVRTDNFRCGQGVTVRGRTLEEQVFYNFYSVLMVTNALEILFWPASFVGNIVRFVKKQGMFLRGKEEKEHRIQYMFGFMFRCLQCLSCGKAGGKDFKNKGELKDFAVQFMELANFETNVDFVLSDVYIGLVMLGRDQLERREAAIQLAVKENNIIRNLVRPQLQVENNSKTEGEDPIASQPHRQKLQKRGSVYILQHQESSTYQVCERHLLLQSNEEDRLLMQDLAYYSRYAQIIYKRVQPLTVEEFGLEDNATHFTRGSDTLFESRYRLSSLDCEHAMLSYACFLNGIVSTPYAILVDTAKEKVVITIRGTISIEDMVVDMQYKPAGLEKVGVICGTDLKGHCCHKGMLARSKWLYNSLRSEKVIKTLYSDESPFKDYGLVVCGHSLGGGCASLLAVMLRPSFPSIRCFAYEPPGGLIDEDLATKCEDFIVSTVKQDDIVPRLSHQNFDALRDNFFDILARIKVPKIQAFHDTRTPCTGASVKQRNSKILRHQTDIPTDTAFYQQLQKFRSERAEADYEKLYLPGKLVHLLDPGDSRPHIPYYASKHEFNHVAISKTMISDHRCFKLVGFLQNAQLCGGKENSMVSFVCNNSIAIQEEEEEEEEDAESSRFFMWCSNPYGRFPILLTLGASIAVLCSILSVTTCKFFTRSVSVYQSDVGDHSLFKITSVGLFSTGLLDCDKLDQNCTEFDKYTESPYCIPYSESQLSQNDWLSKAQIFVACQMVFAFVSLLLLCISTCYRIGRNAWIVICFMLLLSTLFQGLVFVIHRDNCGDSVFPIEDPSYSIVTSCDRGRGASSAIAACCFYFMTAVGSIYFACKK
uniref:sn-1-specific diacylglycerol lipase n=1 Tax=Skeletonema marinoi TaxID=267567 RepID=A0A7S2P2B1_9STRA|mmetsp:Transcript_10958/g.18668  ORF Transcript_10958/g.18668 Transcript_10958/m.18668 type:complete len:998 (+) Transcript_10958:52-3045(+)